MTSHRLNAKQIGIWLLRLLAVLYFVAAFGIVGARWFVTTQLDDYRGHIASTLSKMLGVTIEADAVDASFNVIRPVLHLENVRIARPGGPVSLTLPALEAELSWSTLLHLEPRFHRLDITGAELTVRRLDETRYDIAGFILDTSTISPKNTSSNDSISTRQNFTPWLLQQDNLIFRNARFRYVDERPKIDHSIDIRDANLVFQQNFSDWRLSAEARLVEPERERHVQFRSIVEKTFFSDNADPLTWKGRAWIDADHIDLARLFHQLGLRSPLNSGYGKASLWVDFN